MWETIKHVTSSLTLAAFIAATVAWVARLWVDRWFAGRTRLVELATDERRQELIAADLERFKVDTRELAKEQKYRLLLEQLKERRRRLRLMILASSVVLGLVVVSLSLPSVLKSYTMEPSLPAIIDTEPRIAPNGRPRVQVESNRPADTRTTKNFGSSASLVQPSHAVDIGAVKVGDQSTVRIGETHGAISPNVGVGEVSAGNKSNIEIGNSRE